MIVYNKTGDFDIDCQFGEIGQKELADIFKSAKIEVKRDRKAWRTKNICIEFRQGKNAKPSGISTTKSDYYCYIFTKDDKSYVYLIISVERLKKIVKRYYDPKKIIIAGDNYNRSVLIPISELFTIG
jgi:hypothetical protein